MKGGVYFFKDEIGAFFRVDVPKVNGYSYLCQEIAQSKTMKVARTFLYFLMFGSLIAALGSCKEEPKEDSQDLGVVSVQILSFKISSNELPVLGETFFSIDHRAGRIYNAIPLPYQSDFGKVKMEIKTVSSNQIEVYVGGELRQQEADSVDLSGWKKGLKVVISDSQGTLKKSYDVDITDYQYDPLLFQWEKVATDMLPSLSDVEDMTLDEGTDAVYLSYFYANRCDIYKAEKANPTSWKKYYSFEGKVRRATVVDDACVLLFDDGGRLHFAEPQRNIEKSYDTDFENGYNAYALMGGFSVPGEEVITACMLAKETSGKNLERYAVIYLDKQTGELKSKKLAYAEAFNFPHGVFESKVILEAGYPKLLAVGGRPDINAEGSAPGIMMTPFSTTTGLDWLTPQYGEESEMIAHADSRPVLVRDAQLKRYYLYVPYESYGYSVFYSEDGANWLKGDNALMLKMSDEQIGGKRAMVGYSHGRHDIILLGGKDDAGRWINAIWKGYPRIYEEK